MPRRDLGGRCRPRKLAMHDQRCMQAPILTLIVWGLVGCLEVEVLKPLKGAGASFFIETAYNCGALSYLDYIYIYIHTYIQFLPIS